MSQTETSSDAATGLLRALEQNEFDIAGLADFCVEQKCVDECLRQLYQIIQQQREPKVTNKKLLAQVLVGMLYVARNDYAADGHQEFWPFLFNRIRKVTFADSGRFSNNLLSGQQNQALLGRWFRGALDAFGYSIPSEGQTYVGPIVFHAGMPTSSLLRVMSVIAMACDQFGPQVISLPADIRSELVKNHFLHRNVERLLSSNLQGAAQLWGCLARVVLAWKTQGDCSDELLQLPSTLDPDEVRAALPSYSETLKVARTAFPQLRYDSETGEIRLTFPGEGSTNWKVTSDQNPIELSWSRTHLGKTAEFNGPLPKTISVEPTGQDAGIGRVFTPYPADWPGYWFHAHNGRLEDGQVIDASGLGSGRWYVVFEGTPSQCSVPSIAQVQLKWSWFEGNQDWTAWEVEVPPRTASQKYLEWFVDDNCFRVPLAQRPGPRVEFVDSPIAKAATSEGNQLEVYSSAPTVILRRESPISMQLLRESSDNLTVIERIDLKPETATRLPVLQAGIYQLRELRGVGRTLLQFAIVPELTIQGPVTDSKNISVAVEICAADNAGQVCDDGGIEVIKEGRQWMIRSSTVEPMLKVGWSWSTDDIPPLIFRWPVEALRWRITHAGDEYAGWTREPLFISKKTVDEQDAQLEIQSPAGSELLVNGEIYRGRLQASLSGNVCVLSLNSYGETIELSYDGQQYTAVLQSDRPILDSFAGEADTGAIIVNWKSEKKLNGMVVVAWDPSDILSKPQLFSLSETEILSSEWISDCDKLPGDKWTSISLARSVGTLRKVLHMAARRVETLEPASLLLNRTTGEVRFCDGRPKAWSEFLHHISFLRLNRSTIDFESIATLLSELVPGSTIDLAGAIRLLTDLLWLLAETSTHDRDRNWAQVIHRAVLELVRRVCRENPGLALSQQDDSSDVFSTLLEMGIPVGQFYPFCCIATGQLPSDTLTYPVTYIRDLWFLGMGRRLLEHQLEKCGETLPQDFEEIQIQAASRVLDFHWMSELPSISRFLPLNGQTATTDITDRGHCHSFAIPSLPASIETADEFCELLGIQDKALDCQATCDDQFFDVHSHGSQIKIRVRGRSSSSPAGYSLYWCEDESRWVIENMDMSPPTCCYTKTQPLIVEPVPVREFARTTLCEKLIAWTQNESVSPELISKFNFLDQYKDILVSDAISGPLHAELFKPAETETKELFGRMVQVETQPGLSPLATIVWQIAWIERVSAWKGEQAIFKRSEEGSAVQREFLNALAIALNQWPALMRRTIALAELVYWTLYRGGLGAAAKFRCDHIEDQVSVLRKLSQASVTLAVSSTAQVRPAGEIAGDVSGIIVGYEAGIGIVLLHHRSSPSLENTVKDYVTHGNAERHWFASFRWRAIKEGEREQLQKIQSRGAGSGTRKHSLSLADVMCGMRVTCNLQKNPKWEAVDVIMDFSTQKVHLPKYRRRQPI